MTDTLTARPEPPAWLNLDAVISPELREKAFVHAEKARAEWIPQMLLWLDGARYLFDDIREELKTHKFNDLGGITIEDGIAELIDRLVGVDALNDIAVLLWKEHKAIERATPCGPLDEETADWRLRVLGTD